MAEHHEELIKAARRLVRRRVGQRGALSSARIRRSVSTAYYALFHFVIDEAARTLVGTHNDLRRRRRTLARVFSHAGIKATLDRIRGAQVDAVAADLLRPRGSAQARYPRRISPGTWPAHSPMRRRDGTKPTMT